MKTLTIRYMAVIALACAAFVGLAPKAGAVPQIVTDLFIGDTHELGFVNFGIPSGDADRTTYTNHLVGMALGGHDFGDGQEYFRSMNNFGALPAAVFNHNNSGGGNPPTSIDLGSTAGVYTYLFAKYDGPNYGSEVWYVGNLTGIITIPANPPGGGNGLSGWTLFGPGGNTVPEGGSTIAFLGMALTAAELLRRGVRRRAAVKA